jgi:catechol 2,3-dioxygenase-like lactoylglutathione lyase family enzyme
VKVKRIGYLGVRTPHVEEMTSFFRDVLGLEGGGGDENATFTRLPTNRRDLLEVYSPTLRDERMIPNDVDFMVGFVVDDLEEALAEVKAAGLELVNDVIWAAEAFGDPSYEGFGWFFVRAPDGRVYAIEQMPD